MKQKRKKRPDPAARDVIRSGSFLAPMAQWVPLAAAASKPKFDEVMAVFEKWIDREFRRLRIQSGDYDELARKLRPHGLIRGAGEDAKEFCWRVFLSRRRALTKPVNEAFRRPGRPARSST
jgi:hypothetical protein